MADLSFELAGIRFKNPVWMASGEPTETYDKMKRAIDAGAGAVVAKSYCSEIEVKRQTDLSKYFVLGYDRRPVYGKDVPKFYTLYSRGGTIQASEDEWFEDLAKAQKYASKSDAIVIGSVFGHSDTSETARLARKMEEIGLKMLELDLGCPHPEEMKSKGALVKEREAFVDVIKKVTGVVSIPVFGKLSPQQMDLETTANSVKEAGAAGVTVHNRFLGFAVDIQNAKPHIWGWAGVGGPWMLPIALRWVSKIHCANPELPILGSSGAYDWEDVVQFLMSGATAVEFCSTVMLKGYSVIKKSIQGLNDFLDSKGYHRVQEIVGIATKAAYGYEQMYTLHGYMQRASVDMEKCIVCGKCVECCWYDAMEEKDGVVKVNVNKCKGCYSCRVVCPVEAVSMLPIT